MRNITKIVLIAIFSLIASAIFIQGYAFSGHGLTFAQKSTTPTPTPAPVKANTNTAVTNTSAANAAATPAPGGSKKITKEFTLAKDAIEVGQVEFNHDNHALMNYSADGKSKIACVECHHTDQPKSALQPPLVTSERDAPLTLESFQASNLPVKTCRTCHFQEGSVPDGQTQPSATYTTGGKSETKEINNELAYHNNCNVCHDKAAATRPEVKKNPKFATSNDCTICHKQ